MNEKLKNTEAGEVINFHETHVRPCKQVLDFKKQIDCSLRFLSLWHSRPGISLELGRKASKRFRFEELKLTVIVTCIRLNMMKPAIIHQKHSTSSYLSMQFRDNFKLCDALMRSSFITNEK